MLSVLPTTTEGPSEGSSLIGFRIAVFIHETALFPIKNIISWRHLSRACGSDSWKDPAVDKEMWNHVCFLIWMIVCTLRLAHPKSWESMIYHLIWSGLPLYSPPHNSPHRSRSDTHTGRILSPLHMKARSYTLLKTQEFMLRCGRCVKLV